MHKLSRAESGKLGAARSKVVLAEQKQARIDEYNKHPAYCKECSLPLPYKKRKNDFCNRSCAATYNNVRKAAGVECTCGYCGKVETLSKHRAREFCNAACRGNATKLITYSRVTDGLVSDRGIIRSSLVWKNGRKCSHCGLTEWMGHPIPIEVDHIDGNAGNNSFDNLRLLCPNCHGITPTWKGRNKGSGRAARGLPLS